MEKKEPLIPFCPISLQDDSSIQLAHGGGGRLMHSLIEKMFLPAFENPVLLARNDGATFSIGNSNLAFTTDSFVVRPLFFPGGDIGTLAVNGTVNDLAMCGARPLYLSAGFILEEGLPVEALRRIVQSMKSAAEGAGVRIITGDTKVVDRGKGDGVFINTTGIGVLEFPLTIGPSSVRPGDLILLNGDIGRHGMAIMAVREGLEFESAIESDSASLSGLVMELLSAGVEIHCMRDLTRGGLASALIEIAGVSGCSLEIDEESIPVGEAVQGACEILGIDPIHVANEGRFVIFVPVSDAGRALSLMKAHPLGRGSTRVGEVKGTPHPPFFPPAVIMKTRIGVRRIIDMLSGDPLPRIC